MIPQEPNGLVAYRLSQVEKRQGALEDAVGQTRDAIISIRNDVSDVRREVAEIRRMARAAETDMQHRGDLKWTKLQVFAAYLAAVIVFAFNVYFAAKGH